MRHLAFCLLFSLFGVVMNARADVVDYYFKVPSRTLYYDLTVAETGTMIIDDLYVGQTLTITNYGAVDAGITVAENSTLVIENYGNFNADFSLEDNAKLYQLITNADSITDIGIDVEYSLLVQNTDVLNLNDVINVAGCTDKIILENAQLSLNGAIDTYGIDFDISGNIVLHVTNIDRYADNQILLRNVSGTGAFVVLMDDVSDDLLFVHVAYVSDGNLYLRRVRNTNYSSIMKDEVGAMLDSVRVYNPNDSLLRALDAAPDMGTINSVLSRSVRMRPIRLMQPIVTMNQMKRLYSVMDGDSVYAMPFTIISDNNNIYGLRSGVNFVPLDSLHLSADLVAGTMEYDSDIDSAKSVLYGGNIDARYLWENIFVRGVVGVMYADFDVGPVMSADGIEYNPTGVTHYFMGQVGYTKKLNNAFSAMGFVGADTDIIKIAGDDDSVWSMHAGAGLEYRFEMAGIEYKYSASVHGNTNSSLGAGVRVAFRSVFDEVGGSLDIVTMRDDFGAHYELKANATIDF